MLRVNVGHTHKVSPRELVGAITGESGISSRDIGAIGIRQQYSVVDVAEEVAGHVLAVLNRGVFICGTRVTAVVDDSGTGAAHPRKPLNFGPRRQRPVKYGKKPRGAAHERGE